MPRFGPLPLFVVIGATILAGGCAALHIPSPSMPSFGKEAVVGTPSWWKKHKKKATFVPGSGYEVAGVEGYFDDLGRPIKSKVAKVVNKKTDGGVLGDVGFQQKVRDIKEQVGLGPDESAQKLAYDLGEDMFRYQRYDDAAKKYKESMKAAPDTALEQDAMFMLGESYFFGNKYSKASKTFEKLIHKYPNSPHIDKIVARQFAIARYWEQYNDYNPNMAIHPNLVDNKRPLFDTFGHAIRNYEQIRINDPTGPLADDAVMAAANAYFLHRRFNEADEQYALLRKEYPRSEHQFNAHILGLQAKLHRYQGPAYDGTPLQEAQTLITQLKQQFSGRLDADQRQRLGTTEAQIRRELAQRDFNMGTYYAALGENASARFYFAEVLKKHGTTPLAEDARTQLASLKDLPDRPKSRIEPLLNLVPQNSERKAVAGVPMIEEGPDSTKIPEAESGPLTATQSNAADSNAPSRR